MRSQRIKEAYFTAARPLSKLNNKRWKARFSRSGPSGRLMVNLGSGSKYLDGFVNIDIGPVYKKDVWLDIRNGLPFTDETVDVLYSSHLLEHLFIDELQRVLRECHRVLKPSGAFRILVPSVEKAVQAYVSNDREWFADWPRSFESIGGRLCNYLLCDGQHRSMFDFVFMREMLLEAGFASVVEGEPRASERVDVATLSVAEPLEPEVDRSLVVEASKSAHPEG